MVSRRWRWWSVVLAGCVGWSVAWAARPEPENEPDPRTRATAGIAWCRPAAQGAPRVLFLCASMSAWDVYALAQRMELEYDVCYTQQPWTFAPTTDYYHEGIKLLPEVTAELHQLLDQPWDVLAFVDFVPTALPPELQFRVLEKIVQGTGAVTFMANRWPNAWNYPGIQSRSDTSLFASLPRAGLTLPDLRNPLTTLVPDMRGNLLPTTTRFPDQPFEFTPVQLHQMGKGLVVDWQPGGANYFGGPAMHPSLQQSPEGLLQAEYFYGLAAKLVRLAAGKAPAVRLEALDADGKQFAAGQPLAVGAKLSGSFTGEARIVLRTPRNQVVHEARAPVTPDALLVLTVPAQPAGGYFADVWLLQDGKVVDWASAWLTVAAPAVQLALELPAFSAGPEQTLAARVVATGAPPGASVVARLVDAAGRSVVSLPAVPLREGRAELAVPLARTRELRYLLEAELVAGGQPLATAQTPVFVTRPWTPDLFVYTDGEARNYGGKLRFDLYRELGITTVELGSDGITPYPDTAMASGLRPGYRVWTTHCHPYTGGCISSPTYAPALSATFAHMTRQLLPYGLTFFSIGDDSGVAQDFCTSPPNWVRSYIVKLSTHYRGDSAAYFKAHQMPNKWGNFRYMMQQGTLAEIAAIAPTAEELPLLRQAWQENYPDLAAFNRAHGTTFASYEAVTPAALAAAPALSPCLVGFQDAMRRQYGTLAALNAAWGTKLADFTAITPTLTDELLAQGNFAAKLDRNWYLEELFLANMAAAAKGVREVSPDVGIGMGAASVGNIIPEVLARIDSVMPYKGDRDLELIRSVPHRFCGQTIGVYGGKAVPQPARENQAWETVFSGGNFIWFWSMITGGLEGDLSLNPGRAGYLLAAIQELQGGIAQALIRAQRQHDGIALLHQRRAGGLSSFHKELGSQESSQVGFQRILEDLGLQYRYTWTSEVEGGVLDRGEFKLLILPYTQILSEGEVAAIARFVAAGGTVLADLRCATHDWQGRPLPAGRLDALFGVRQAPAQAVPAKGDLRWATGSVPQLRGDGSVTAAGAEARATLGSVPAVLVRPSGQGRAIFLNHSPTTYYSLLNRQAAGPLRQLYLGLLAEAGIRPRGSVTDAAGQPVAGAELAFFREGPLEYLTIEKNSFEYERYPLAATVQLDRPYAVYDVRAGKALGQVDRIPVTLTGLGSYVYALLPAAPGPLVVTAPATVAPGGEAVVAVAVGSKAPHQVRVELLQPDGKRLWPVYKLPAREGVATVTVPIADNDPPGPWRLVVTDVTTGRSHTQPLEVTR